MNRPTSGRPAGVPADSYLEVRGLQKRFGDTDVLHDVCFGIAEGEFVCFLGPSGCGKTTLLLCLAGLEPAQAGDILKQGVSIAHLPPSRRDVGIVFQSYALFPNLTVFDNIAFGLVSQRQARGSIERTVGELIVLLSLQGHEHKFPSQLSGGQQQRVALARSLALKPSLLLLDEPLSALDAQVRTRLRGELRELQTRLGLTTIMVTHDQEEALSLSDRIVLMNQGRIEQIGTPWQIYNQPANAFVADFIGSGNLHAGTAMAGGVRVDGFVIPCSAAATPNQALRVLLRPEDMELSATRTTLSFVSGVVNQVEHLGAVVRAHLQVGGGECAGTRWVVDVAKKTYAQRPFAVGESRWLGVHADDVQVFS
jgi:iron(III) transport system ATP-binding protein